MTGNHLSFEDRVRDNITALRLVMPDVLMRERERAHTKWYAYRFMSPLEATKLLRICIELHLSGMCAPTVM